MKTDEVDVLNPVSAVTKDGQSVEVTALNWRDYLFVVKKLTTTAFSLLGDKVDVAAIQRGEVSLDYDKIVAAITEQEELAAFVFAKSLPGRDAEFVKNLSALEAVKVLEKVVALNLSPELIQRGKSLAGQMAAAFGVSKKGSPEPSTLSSAPATTSRS